MSYLGQRLEIGLVRLYLKTVACRIADLELLVVLLLVSPVLLFDSWVPAWAVAVALAAIPVLWVIRWLGYGSPIRATPLDLPILILLLMVPAGVWAAAVKSLSLPQIYRIVLGVALFYAMVNVLTTGRCLQVATVLVLAATAALGVLALVGTDWVPGEFSLPLLDAISARLPVVFRPFWNPEGFGRNTMGGILAMTLPLLIAFAVGARRWLVKAFLATASIIGCLALLLSQSRGGILGLLLAILIMGMARSRRFLMVVLILVSGGLLLGGMMGIESIRELFFSSAVDSPVSGLEERLGLWSRALHMIQDFPATGVGLGMFGRVLRILYPLQSVGRDVEIPHPHNILLSQAVDAGLPGLVAFAALLLILFFMAARSIRLSRRTEWWPLAVGLLGALVAFVVHGQFDSVSSYIKAHTVFWGLIGLQTALWLYLRGHKKCPGLGS